MNLPLAGKKTAVYFCGSIYPGKKPFTKESIKNWMKAYPHLTLLGDITMEIISGKPGDEVNREDWRKLCETVVRQYKKYEAFLVILPPDNVLTAMAEIAFMLGKMEKPFAFTTISTNKDLAAMNDEERKRARSGAEWNLANSVINGVHYVFGKTSGYAFVFGNTVFPALRTYLVSEGSGDQFEALSKKYWGIIDLDIRPTDFTPAPQEEDTPDFRPITDGHVLCAQPEQLTFIRSAYTSKQPLGVVVPVPSTGRIDEKYLLTIQALQKNNIIAVLWNPYDDTTHSEKITGVPYVRNTPLHIVLAKLAWVLDQGGKAQDIIKRFTTDRSGEQEGVI